MPMSRKQFFENFLSNVDFANAKQGITVSSMDMKTEPMNWADGIKVFRLASRSEVSITLECGSIHYDFVYALNTEVSCSQLMGMSNFTIADLNPIISLDDEVIEGYPSSLFSDDEVVTKDIKSLFGNSGADYYVNSAKTDRSVELHLRKAVAAKLSEIVEQSIKDNDFNSPLMLTMSEIAKDSFNVAITALQSMTEVWANNPLHNAVHAAA